MSFFFYHFEFYIGVLNVFYCYFNNTCYFSLALFFFFVMGISCPAWYILSLCSCECFSLLYIAFIVTYYCFFLSCYILVFSRDFLFKLLLWKIICVQEGRLTCLITLHIFFKSKRIVSFLYLVITIYTETGCLTDLKLMKAYPISQVEILVSREVGKDFYHSSTLCCPSPNLWGIKVTLISPWR